MKNKIKLARKLRTKHEIKAHVSIFQTKAWEDRKKAIAERVERRQINIKKKD